MSKNIFLILENITESVANATAVWQKSLDFLAKILLDYRIALDYVLAEQGSVCAVTK